MELKLLDLQKDASPLAANQNTPFLLSLRDPEEFSEIHSFGFFKVPHIGVYGSEYTLCSAVALLSLPAIPRCLQQLPADLIRALGLELELPTPRELERATARQLVQFVLEAACRRAGSVHPTATAVAGRYRMGVSPTPVDMAMTGKYPVATITAAEGVRNKYRMNTSVERAFPSENPVSAKTMGREGDRNRTMDVSPLGNTSSWSAMETDNIGTAGKSLRPARNCPLGVRFVDPTMPSLAMMLSWEDDKSIAAARRGLARRLVVKCISAACHRMASESHRDSLEYLISSTKRMRISGPSLSSEETTESPSLNTVSSPLTERSTTPESMKMQKLRKKRGRSESHEVNSLTDYNMIARHFRDVVTASGSDRRGVGQFGSRGEGEDAGNLLGTLVENLGMMTINEDGSDSDSEEATESPPACLADGKITAVYGSGSSTFQFAVPPNTTPPLFTALPNTSPPLFTAPPNTTHPLFTAPPNTTPLHTDFRRTANIGSVPGMDLYAVIHSCPPHGMCQKFLCSNCDEINLVYHCWLFGDASCDPSITFSDELALGVFDPCGVQPVHLELQDAGAPFYYLENRTICIHSCCFSPDNAQLQLVQAESPTAFHSFFSAARHGERRVAALHILPSSVFMENTLRESLAGCATLRQLLLRLCSQFPEIGSKIWSLVSLL